MAVLRSVGMSNGARCVIMDGGQWMPVSPAGSWDSQELVSDGHNYQCDCTWVYGNDF
jgi:hypothetical protein